MISHAEAMGANGILGFHYDATELSPGVTEVLAYGTAVMMQVDQTASYGNPR